MTTYKIYKVGWSQRRTIPLIFLSLVTPLFWGAALEPSPDYVLPAVTAVNVEKLKAAVDAARGKVLVMNFWATWCPPCVKEMPEFAEFHRKYSAKNVALLSVSADGHDHVEKVVKPFMTSRKIPFPVHVIDAMPDAVSAALKLDWEGGLPATFVFDAKGKLVKAWFEELTLNDLATVVDPLLKRSSPEKVPAK